MVPSEGIGGRVTGGLSHWESENLEYFPMVLEPLTTILLLRAAVSSLAVLLKRYSVEFSQQVGKLIVARNWKVATEPVAEPAKVLFCQKPYRHNLVPHAISPC